MVFKKLFLLHLVATTSAMASLNTGDGSDGACVWGGGARTNKEWNCTSLSVTGPTTFAAGGPIVIRVQDNVSIQANITLNGQNGNGGGAGAPGASAGGNGGAGGTPGVGSDGGGSGAGLGSPVAADSQFIGDAGGGGGGGASYGTLGGSGLDGSDAGVIDPDPGLGGARGNTYLSALSFNSTFVGGSGGGGGSNGEDQFGIVFNGGRGGGGGGALRFVVGGDFEILAGNSIEVNGGDGQNGASSGANTYAGGGGGAGSGGALWIAAQGNIEVAGDLSALGGTGGASETSGPNGTGGNGGNGIIRLEDSDGVITGAGSVSPAPVIISLSTGLPVGSKKQYESTLTTACGSITDDGPNSALGGPPPSVMWMCIGVFLLLWLRRKALV